MFDRFTNQTRGIVVLAQHEAYLLALNNVRTEHILAAPKIIALEIMENIESGLTEFSAIVEELEAGKWS